MKHIYFLITGLFLLAGIQKIYCQDSVNAYNSSWKIDKGVKLHDEGSYKEALDIYNTININDSSYFRALVEKSLSLLKLKKYKETVDICEEALRITTEKSPNIYVHLATALEELGNVEEALKKYDEGIRLFPANYNLYYNKAVTLEATKDLHAAVLNYKKALMLNPFHPASHLRLGHLSADRGYFTQALLSLVSYLMVAGNDSMKLETLSFLDKFVAEKYTGEIPEIEGLQEKEFSKTDMILGNMLAMHKDYKFKFKLDYPLIRQFQIMLQNLEKSPNSKGFWMNYYVPFYSRILSEDQFEGCVYLILSSATKKKIRDEVSDHQKEVKSFSKWARDAWMVPYQHIDIPLDPLKPENMTIRRDVNDIQAMGEKDNEDKRQGRWVFFSSDGGILSYGDFQHGLRNGEWNYFYDNGQKSYFVEFKEDKVNGKLTEFDASGYKIRESVMAGGLLQGVETKFYASGDTLESINYSSGKMEGKGFSKHRNGMTEMLTSYANNLFTGKIFKYHDNGKTQIEAEFNNGKRDGVMKQYYRDGTPSKTENFTDDKSEGSVTEYFSNGTVSYQGTTANDLTVKESSLYFRNGKLKESCPYNDKGKIHGQLKYYDSDGLLHYTIDYENDIPVAFTSYDKGGKILSEGKAKKDRLAVDIQYPEGGIMTRGEFVKGKKDGVWTYYNRNGVISKKENYKDGKLEGKYEEFFGNGKVEKIFNYVNGVLTGPYIEYYFDETVYCLGAHADGSQVGLWKYFDPEGILSSESYFLDGKYEGFQRTYSPSGNILSQTEYSDGAILRDFSYDTLGKVVTEAAPKGYTGLIRMDYPGSIKRAEYSLKNGNMDGMMTWYFPNGNKDVSGEMFDGKRDGLWTWFYPDGKVRLQGKYQYGDKTGVWTEYQRDGKLSYEKNYVEDNLEGPVKVYDYTGNLYYSGNNYEDHEEGLFRFYSGASQLQYILNYHEGTLTSYSYNDNSGKPLEMIPIINGTADIKAKYSNGNTSLEGRIVSGLYQGNWKSYYENGKLLNETQYIDGRRTGIVKNYYPNGQLRKAEPCSKGYKNGIVTLYYPNGKIKEELSYRYDKMYNWSRYYDDKGNLLFSRYYYDDDLLQEISN